MIVRIHQEGAPRDPEAVLPVRLYATRKAFGLSPDIGFVTRRRFSQLWFMAMRHIPFSKPGGFDGVLRVREVFPYLDGYTDPFTGISQNLLAKLLIALIVK